MIDLFPTAVYTLCFLTSTACAVLLARSYSRSRTRLLLWSALCFAFLAANNFVVIIDLLVLPDTDYRLVRYFLLIAALGVLLFGFIWDREDQA